MAPAPALCTYCGRWVVHPCSCSTACDPPSLMMNQRGGCTHWLVALLRLALLRLIWAVVKMKDIGVPFLPSAADGVAVAATECGC